MKKRERERERSSLKSNRINEKFDMKRERERAVVLNLIKQIKNSYEEEREREKERERKLSLIE